MFLETTLRRNPALIDAAIDLHSGGRIGPNTFVIDLDRVESNAQANAEAARGLGLKLQAMTKQHGRNPFVALAATAAGIGGIVTVDVPEARILARHGLPIAHVGHLVQVPAADTADVLAMRPAAWTVFSVAAAERVSAAAQAVERHQDVLLRVWKPGDFLHPGQEGGFRPEDVAEAGARISRLPGVRVAGVTSFPCLLWDVDARVVRATGNLDTVTEAARVLREDLGLELNQVNAPGVTCVGTMAIVAERGATHVEPGSALSGHTPLHAAQDEPELPAMVYVSEIASVDRGTAYCFGGGFYARSRLRSALLASHGDRRIVPAVQLPAEAIDYYGTLDVSDGPTPSVGDTAVFAFRSQVFVGRCQVAIVGGLAFNAPEVLGIFDQHGNLLGSDQLPVGAEAAVIRVGERWAEYVARRGSSGSTARV